MYCTCHNPQPMKNDANGVVFTVCAKSKGGCGEEVLDLEALALQSAANFGAAEKLIFFEDEETTLARLGLKLHGPCDYAGCGKPGICSHQNTQYVNERSNYNTLCEAHQIEVDAHWDEMWKDYWSGRL